LLAFTTSEASTSKNDMLLLALIVTFPPSQLRVYKSE
jgi:hypothetical protein